MRNSVRLKLCFAALLLPISLLIGSVSAQETASEPKQVDVLGEGKMEVPADFKQTKPRFSIGQLEFQVGEGDNTGRLTLMRAGGGVEANIKRWKGQFSGGAEEDQKTEKMTLGPFEVHLVDVQGTYAERMGGGPFAGGKMVQREDYAMVGAILVSPEGPMYFAKLVGPADVVKANREKFVAMIKSVDE